MEVIGAYFIGMIILMVVNGMMAYAPFSLDEVRSINQGQLDGRITPLTCARCKARVFAQEQGLKCPECFEERDRLPVMHASWGWTRFKMKIEENR